MLAPHISNLPIVQLDYLRYKLHMYVRLVFVDPIHCRLSPRSLLDSPCMTSTFSSHQIGCTSVSATHASNMLRHTARESLQPCSTAMQWGMGQSSRRAITRHVKATSLAMVAYLFSMSEKKKLYVRSHMRNQIRSSRLLTFDRPRSCHPIFLKLRLAGASELMTR